MIKKIIIQLNKYFFYGSYYQPSFVLFIILLLFAFIARELLVPSTKELNRNAFKGLYESSYSGKIIKAFNDRNNKGLYTLHILSNKDTVIIDDLQFLSMKHLNEDISIFEIMNRIKQGDSVYKPANSFVFIFRTISNKDSLFEIVGESEFYP